ncbi:phospholipase D-like domain-containing protein [Calderihabitans maritimus]|uniref:Helicase-like protein n=1 Tax=Calderihabitans maritimus TaxID=1246530 RepID=A0A1Z5HQK7_9FIRM|nr:phospholipase D-like domain-containing protein [Calderihabitans maritimus]GAW91809.1 helicase-like protein [Calderihabitans maritimus]
MTVNPFNVIIDNKAGIVQEEGAVKDILQYYVNEAKRIKKDQDFQFRLDIGTGYLFFSGFEESFDIFKEMLTEGLLQNINEKTWNTKSPIRIVMGPETTGFTKEVLTSIVKDNISRYPDDCVQLLKEMIEKELIEFRVYLDRKFHVKMYNFYLRSSVPDDIWTGSANFTRGGLTSNIELCVPVQTTSQTRTLFRKWFDEL